MRLDAFFEKFELFADAPNAVEKMRELVLLLAYSGGLTGDRQGPDGLPVGWERRSIESIAATIVPGFACSKSHQVADGHVHLRTHNISTLGTLNFDLMIRIDPAKVDVQKSSVRAGDILFNNTNSQELVGKTSLVDRDYEYGFSNHITRLRLKDEVFPGFVAFYLTHLRNSGYFARLCTRWINQAAVNTETLKTQEIPLPPLAEQKRIVAKVDELMALCDRLEAQQQERQTRHAALAGASLARFAEAPTPANLDFLFHDAYAIEPDALRAAILSLAVQGRLVSQDRGDQAVEELLTQIRSDNRPFCKTDKPAALPLTEEETPYDLPAAWSWMRTGDLAQPGQTITYGILKPVWVPSGVPTVRVTEMKSGVIDVSALPMCSADRAAKFSKTRLCAGDLLISKDGTVGKTAFVPPELAGGNITQHMLRFPISKRLDRHFIRICIDAPPCQAWMIGETKGVALQGVNVGDFRRMPLPIPPLAEQRRIVAKVNQLMTLVDQLQARLATARTTSAALLEAAIHELLQPTATIVPFPSAERDPLLDRAEIGCYAIQQLGDKRTFGRTAEVKVLYLAEAHLGLGLGGRYLRDAAGPLDHWIYKFEEEAARQQWFSVVESLTKEGHKKIDYRPGPNLSPKAQEGATRLSAAQREEFDRLLGLLAQKPTVEVEIIATLFAAWNDFLIDGRTPSDDEIVQEVRENWHPSKRRFTGAELKAWLTWLRKHALVPDGKGPHTVGQQGKLQLH